MNVFLMYLLNVAMKVQGFIGAMFFIFSILGVVLGVIALITAVYASEYEVEDPKLNAKKLYLNHRKKVFWVYGLLALFVFLVPSKKELVEMYIIPKIVNSKDLKELPARVSKALDKYIEKND